MSTLLIAAGGGGDAIAAAMLAADPEIVGGTVCGIATFSWDRLLIDPLPGPRTTDDFTGLKPLGDGAHIVAADTRPLPPAGSTLPRLAAALQIPLIFLDPKAGCEGLGRQVRAACTALGAARLLLVDVGGDIVARDDEPELRSPLADGLAAAACGGLGIPVDVVVAGPGLDGELAADAVRAAAGDIGGQLLATLNPDHARCVAGILAWHPSEVTGLLAAAANGVRGTVEIRDNGTPITLDHRSAEVWSVPLRALTERSLLIGPLAATSTLVEAEAVVRRICGRCETDYERAKAASRGGRRTSREGMFTLANFENAVHGIETASAARGADYVTLRRLIEVAGGSSGNHDRLRTHLERRWPDRYLATLWRVGP